MLGPGCSQAPFYSHDDDDDAVACPSVADGHRPGGIPAGNRKKLEKKGRKKKRTVEHKTEEIIEESCFTVNAQ